MSGELKSVRDELNREHLVVRSIGSGGQGTVYALKGGQLAAKVLTTRSDAERQRLRQRLTSVRRLPLEGLPIAAPREVLAPPHVGYIMSLLSGVIPISRFFSQPGNATGARWYAESGGLRKRLAVLARVAEIFAELHGRALAYGDPSPANILMSAADNNSHQAWLIDADNIVFESSPLAASTMLYSTGYGAPELVAGRAGVSTLTDVHALAVLIFQSLTLVHPFIGDLVHEGPPEMEEAAFAGEVPWIEDPADSSNRTVHGVPRERVIAPRLRKELEQMFGPGLRSPADRPRAAALADALYSALDNTISCTKCAHGFYAGVALCPWCEAPSPTAVRVTVSRVFFGEDRRPSVAPGGSRAVLSMRQAIDLPERLTGIPASECEVRVGVGPQGVEVSAVGQQTVTAGHATRTAKKRVGQTPHLIPFDEQLTNAMIHLGPSDGPHRLLTFQMVKVTA